MFLERVFGVFRLDVDTFEEIEHAREWIIRIIGQVLNGP